MTGMGVKVVGMLKILYCKDKYEFTSVTKYWNYCLLAERPLLSAMDDERHAEHKRNQQNTRPRQVCETDKNKQLKGFGNTNTYLHFLLF